MCTTGELRFKTQHQLLTCMVTIQEAIDSGEAAIEVAERLGKHELAEAARDLTESFRRIAAIEAEYR